MASTAAEWRKPREQGFPVVFPSGLEARLRPVSVDFFMRVGRVPDLMTPFIVRLITDGQAELDIPESYDDILQFNEFLNQLVMFAFVEPEVVAQDPNEDQITLDDLSYGDKLIALRALMVPASQLEKTFFRLSNKNMGNIQSSESTSNETQQNARDQETVQLDLGM